MAAGEFSRLSKIGPSRVEMVLLAGLLAAALDAAYFTTGALLSGRSPSFVLQSIASFWLGSGSYDAGWTSVLLGAATHIGLATAMAAGYALLARRIAFLRGPVVFAGLAYGLFLYCVMYLIVMPLRWPTAYPRWDGWSSVLDIGVHLAIGVLIGTVLRRSVAYGPAAPATEAI